MHLPSTLSKEVKDEVLSLAPADGTLTAQMVLDHARKEGTFLNAFFARHNLWDKDLVYEKALLSISRTIITRVMIYADPKAKDRRPIRAYVSLARDRVAGNGYRHHEHVMSNAELRAEYLATVLSELENIRRKYAHLVELADVFAAIDTAVETASTAGRDRALQ